MTNTIETGALLSAEVRYTSIFKVQARRLFVQYTNMHFTLNSDVIIIIIIIIMSATY